MWTRGDDERKCNKDACMGRKRGSWQCVQCKILKPKTEFATWLSPRKAKNNNGTARCNQCMEAQRKDALAIANKSSAHAATRR